MRNYEFINNIKQLPFVNRIILFGSRARHDNASKSDIDLAISCHNANDRDWLKVLEIIEEADTLLKIDCLHLETLSEHSQLKQNIMQDGVVLYAKDQHKV